MNQATPRRSDQHCDFDQHPGIYEGAGAGNLTPGDGGAEKISLKNHGELRIHWVT